MAECETGAREAGFDAARLARIMPFLEQQYVAPGHLPGAALLVARDGQVVLREGLGVMRADGTPVRDDTIYRIASMTKPVVSIAFMQLVEEGRVALDDAVATIVPELADLGVYAGGGGDLPFLPTRPAPPMRMVDLLTHMAGFTYGFQSRTSVDAAYRKARIDSDRRQPSDAAFLSEVARIPLEFAPGTGWNYSIATDVLGIVVARIAGQPLGAVLRDRIFAPLGMVDTGFHCPAAAADRLADCWAFTPGKPPRLIDRGAESPMLQPATFASGGGGLISTLGDYHRFCRMLSGRGSADGVRIISPGTLALMTGNYLPGGADLAAVAKGMFSEAYNAGSGFGLGFGITLDPVRALVPGSPGEFFWGGIYSTAFFVDPVEAVHMVFMTQLMPSSTYPIRRQLKTLIYAALAESRR